MNKRMDGAPRSNRRAILWLCAGLGMAAFFVLGLDYNLTVSRYTQKTDKLKAPVRLVLLTDLHCCRYGENQEQLLEAIRAENPDAVLMAGDIVDDVRPVEMTERLLRGLDGVFPCYTVTGNHEWRRRDTAEVLALFRRYGVTLLRGSSETLSVRGQTVSLCGVDDPDIGEALFQRQLQTAFAAADTGTYTVLLAHRPDRISQYAQYPWDLVVSGHAHGGQWRMPFGSVSLLAPNQGLLPRYTSGLYRQNDVTLLVSRGLARESTFVPRLYNPPEIVVIDIVPE